MKELEKETEATVMLVHTSQFLPKKTANWITDRLNKEHRCEFCLDSFSFAEKQL